LRLLKITRWKYYDVCILSNQMENLISWRFECAPISVPSVAMAAYDVDDADDERPKNDDRYEVAPLDSAPASVDSAAADDEDAWDDDEEEEEEADDVPQAGNAATPPQRSHAITPRSLRRIYRAEHAQYSHGAEVPRSDVSPEAEDDGASEEAVLPMIDIDWWYAHSAMKRNAGRAWCLPADQIDLNERLRHTREGPASNESWEEDSTSTGPCLNGVAKKVDPTNSNRQCADTE
jgi:hypothetical protein